jgi:hypothetical protein
VTAGRAFGLDETQASRGVRVRRPLSTAANPKRASRGLESGRALFVLSASANHLTEDACSRAKAAIGTLSCAVGHGQVGAPPRRRDTADVRSQESTRLDLVERA